MNRRKFLTYFGLGVAGATLAACGTNVTAVPPLLAPSPWDPNGNATKLKHSGHYGWFEGSNTLDPGDVVEITRAHEGRWRTWA